MITQIALESSNGSYLVAEGGGGREVLANRDGVQGNFLRVKESSTVSGRE